MSKFRNRTSGDPVEGRPHVASSKFFCSFAVCLFLFLAGPSANAIVVLKVGETGAVKPFPHLNGRQIGQSSSGLWFMAFQGESKQGSAVLIAVSKTPAPKFSGDFHPAFTLVSGDGNGVLPSGGGQVRLASFVIDRDDTMHLLWESSELQRLWYSRCEVAGDEPAQELKRRENWKGLGGNPEPAQLGTPDRDSSLGDLALGPSGDLWIAYREAVQVENGYRYPIDIKGKDKPFVLGGKEGYELWIARLGPQGFERSRITLPGPYLRPVMDLDLEGSLHLVSAGRGAHLYYLHYPDFASLFEQKADLTATRPYPLWAGTDYLAYSVVGWGERALVVFERSEHITLYGYFDGKGWDYQSLNPTEEVYRNPILVRDQQGSAWVFWANLSRGHTFFSRWLGTRFGAPYSSRTVIDDLAPDDRAIDTGPTLAPFHTVQRQPGPGSPIGLALSGNSASGPVYFDWMSVPQLQVEEGRKVLFLDLAEVDTVDGLVESFHPMKKHIVNPVIRPGPPGKFDSRRAHAYGEVYYDGKEFRMWYSGWPLEDDNPLFGGSAGHHVGYAVSQDGLHWVKPSLGQYEFDGSVDNNIVDLGEREHGGGHAYMPMVVHDARETDPARRFKMIVEQRGRNSLHFSADGIRWTDGIRVQQKGWSDQRSFFFDSLETDPDKAWKVYSHCGSRAPSGLRKICRDWSADLIHWTSDPRNPVAHPRASTAAEYHMISVWIEAGMYLGLVDSWQHTQVQPQYLMASRDGVNFFHVFDGRAAIELGKAGSWDAGWISPTNVPVMVGDEIWVYYSGGPRTIGGHYDEWYDLSMQTGLATIRRDGFVSLEVQEGKSGGWFSTIPLQTSGSDLALEVNADGLSQGRGRILLDLLAGGEVVATSNAVTEDGVHVPVDWKTGKRLTLSQGLLRLRFRLEGEAALYSFTFQ